MMRSLLLAFAAVSALPSLATADFSVTAGTAEQSGSTSSQASVVRQWTLTATGSSSRYVDQISVNAPGRVFVSYVSGLASGVAGYVNVSGDSTDIVEAVSISNSGDNDDDDEDSVDDDGDKIVVKFDSSRASSGFLLTEIFLAQESTISEVKTQSSADVVLESGVLLASNSDDDIQIEIQGSGSVFVSDSAATISTQEFKAELEGSGSLQLDVSSLTLSEDAEFQVKGSGSITVLASSLSCDELKFDVEGSGSVCISAETVSATKSEVDNASQVSLPNSSNKFSTTGSATCSETTVPSRAPGCIASGCVDTASSSSSTSSSTTAGNSTSSTSSSTSTTASNSTTSDSTTATSTPTPTPTSSGAASLSVAVVGQLAVLALALTM